MPILTFRSPVQKPLLRAGAAKPTPPDPRAYDTFRITQRFGSLDGYFKGQPHNAVDLGNFRCGDVVVAMLAGIATPVQDSAGALGVVVDHGYGVTSEYWHLNRIDVANGQAVKPGMAIGLVGRTGLGDVCHLHVEVKVRGSQIDPEPLMFGGSITVSEDDVKLKGTFLRHLHGVSVELATGSNFRSGVLDGDNEPIDVMPAGTLLYPFAVVTGKIHGTADDRAEWYACLQWAQGSYHIGYYHSSVLTRTVDGTSVALKQVAGEDRSEEIATLQRNLTRLRDRYQKLRAGVLDAVKALGELT